MKLGYILTPEETPLSRNEDFYSQISQDWQTKAKNLQERRWDKIDRKI